MEHPMARAVFYLLLLSLAALGGCARHHKVIIDPQGVDMGLYQRDLAECRQLAEQVESQTGEGAVGGAVVGGLVGAVVGSQRAVERTAGVGAVLGGAKGAGATRQEKERVIKNCLLNRGYKVLN
jgi:outer membrane lipoprotein SlyB